MISNKKSCFISIFRKRIRFFLIPLFVILLILVVHQLCMLHRLSKETSNARFKPNLIILGTHQSQVEQYKARDDGIFKCITSMEKIEYSQINDDYCDCLDGSDEPGTNACPNGRFVCSYQEKYKNYPMVLPSNRVNDGVCDCCDGSDEWKNQQALIYLKSKKFWMEMCNPFIFVIDVL